MIDELIRHITIYILVGKRPNTTETMFLTNKSES